MRQKKIISLLSALLVGLSLNACRETPKKVELTVTPDHAELLPGSTQQLSITVLPEDTKYSIESSDNKIATVSKTGLIIAISAGNTDIKVSAGETFKVVKITVKAISPSRYLGINGSDKEKKFFAPIYIPEQKDFTANNISLFKAAMGPSGWIFKPHEEDPDSKITYYFESPRKLDKNGNPIPREPQFCMDAVVYYHSLSGKEPFIHIVANKEYSKDYMVDPSNFTSPQDVDIQNTLLEIVKHYGFTEEGKFLKVGNDNAYQAYNTSLDPNVPLTGLMYTSRVDEHGYGLFFQINYGKIDRSKK
jgi:Bacterial Ig-like domain (group 2).